MRRWMLFSVVLICGCTSTQQAQMGAYGKSHHIKQFSCGQLVGEWDSVGRVFSEDRSDGYTFEDKKTGTLVEVGGTVQITINQ